MEKYKYTSIKQLNEIITQSISKLLKHRLILINGEMGAGKTTFVKCLGKILGYQEIINSPTYSIIQEYPIDESINIIHIDAYRISQEDIGIDEMLNNPNNLVIIEWPCRISEFLPLTNLVEIHITNDNNHREILLKER
jgi:tRNA threonylcarbamoyladenosine biosynthesis protein TsaE